MNLEEARDALAEAIIQARKANGYDQPELLTGWVVTAAFTQFEGKDSASTSVTVYTPSTMPAWQQVGMLRSGSLLVESYFVDAEDEQD